MARNAAPAVGDPACQAAILRAAAVLLAYPDDRVYDAVPMLASVAAALPRPASEPLSRMVSHLQSADRHEAQRAYVDTFDLSRRCCLFLTYFAFGDTRKRGMALLRFSHTYKAAGLDLHPGELPDHLSVVCEFAAAEPQAGLPLLFDNRAALELIRLALTDTHSPYVDALQLINCVLPPLDPRDLDRALQLAQTGPPAEEVGLEPFAPPEYMGGGRR
jgi:nitrate reductase molybdenum cofactor assembly chaperone NarJ/NarW